MMADGSGYGIGRGNGARARVAVIGSGISGLSAAWLLSKSMDVTVYEADARPGGHANTVDVPAIGRNGESVAIDTGFIVYNDRNYPNLVALFRHLGVPTIASDMSFAASVDGGAFEYSGSGLSGMLGQRSNLVSPRFWRMVSGIRKFYRDAPVLAERQDIDHLTLGEYLDANDYSRSFVEDHLLPMGAAIWSTASRDMRDIPLAAFVRFFVNHGLVVLKGRPQWRTVRGGSREYIRRLLADFTGTVMLDTPVAAIARHGAGVTITTRLGHQGQFDHVVVATHADTALAMLTDADPMEREILGAFRYTKNRAVLHSDPALMPKRRQVWSSWNYMSGPADRPGQPLCVSYWMNRLQRPDTEHDVFVTLNPNREVAPQHVLGVFDYTHPLFDTAAISGQRQAWRLQGRRNTWFCGAWCGSGFHEDGLQSGLAVAESLGGVARPWTVANPSGRIHLAGVAAE